VPAAPVLAGVAAVSGAVASFPAALSVGVAYVFGMVAPLTVMALLWDRGDWGSSRLMTVAARPVRLAGRRVPLSAVLSGGLLVAMGALTVVFAFTGPDMGTGGWQVRVTAFLGHAAATVRTGLGWLPGWVSTLVIFAALAAVIFLALRHRSTPVDAGDSPPAADAPPPPTPVSTVTSTVAQGKDTPS